MDENYSIGNNLITSQGASILFDMLRASNLSIKTIYLSNNQQINDDCMKSLGEYIKSNKNIEAIYLRANTVSDTGIGILVPFLDGNTTFKRLYLNENKGITDKSIPNFVKLIETSYIKVIDIDDTSVTRNGELLVTFMFFKSQDSLKVLNLSNKYVHFL